MVNNSTYINKANNYLSSQLIEHKKDHDIQCWKLGTSLEQGQKSGGIKPINGMTTPPPLFLDNWISNSNTDINENMHRFASTQKDYIITYHHTNE